jgi:hypothetical protein
MLARTRGGKSIFQKNFKFFKNSLPGAVSCLEWCCFGGRELQSGDPEVVSNEAN